MCRHWRWSNRRAPHALLRDEGGTTAVEFALLVWPFMLLLFGTIEVGRVVWTQTALDKTATTAARCIGIRNENCTQQGTFSRDLAVAFIQQEARSWGIALATSAITVEDAASCDGAPGQSKVSLSTDIFSPLPFIAKLMAGSEHMQARACFPTQAAS
ncbi:TadE/TadG family type IV pilus assembly protein [Aureimonas sp. AU12]|uniref:TadE/TadG family type IV pilus assembly protein n=1 Tax=Aureimonas sp. AU12 TaxID=1638161 RepID=UPI0009E6DB80|nr:TadE/TadG family type IV pilus assembly protein [Aureimonas sp. AU12]